MNKTIVEDWSFEIEVLSAGACRIGLETGDAFACTYGCPDGFCPKTMGTSGPRGRGSKAARRQSLERDRICLRGRRGDLSPACGAYGRLTLLERMRQRYGIRWRVSALY